MAKERQGALPSSASTTLSRRRLLDWLGKSAVLALSGEALLACSSNRGTMGDGGIPPDADPDSIRDGALDSAVDSGVIDPWAFSPPLEEDEIYEGWPVRTVDPQTLEEILANFRLRIDGLVQSPLELSFAELVALQRQDQVTDFHCVEGWSVLDVPWNGVHLTRLFELVTPSPEASHVTFHTLGGTYNESLPLDVALEPRTILTYGVAGHTLPLRHGFPLRITIPRLLAYKNAKYVERIELASAPVDGFWVRAGYPYSGEVPPGRLREGRY